MKSIRLSLIVVLIVTVLPFVGFNIPAKAAEETTYIIGISVPTLDEESPFEAMLGGADLAIEELASDELTIEVTALGAENDLEVEAENIQALIDAEVDAIIINPIDMVESLPAIEAAIASEIPVFVVGGEVEGNVASIVIDETANGEKAGELVCENLEEGEGLVLQFEAFSEETEARTEGFASYMEENCPAAEFLSVSIVDEETEEVMEVEQIIEVVSETLLDNRDVSAVFAFDSDTTTAAVSAFITTYSRGVSLVGFGVNEDTLAAVQMGVVNAVVASRNSDIGFAGLEAVVNYLNGEEIESVITVESVVIDGTSDISKACPPRGC
jgi:ribose transport system substrate-binding protein